MEMVLFPANRLILGALAANLTSLGSVTAQNVRPVDVTASTEVIQLPDGWYLGEVAALSRDGHDHLFVFNRGSHPLLEFDSSGSFVKEIGAGLFADPHGLRHDPAGNLWAVDRGAHLAIRFDAAGRVTMVLGMRGRAGTGWFDRDYNVHFLDAPQDIGFDGAGNIFVVDRGNSRILKYNSDGQVLTSWGTQGSGPGEFNFPHSIVVDATDNVYVADRENRRIQIFDNNGRFLREWTGIGYPYNLLMNDDGTIWMTDARAETVQLLSAGGVVLSRIGGVHGKAVGQFGFVHAIAVTGQRELIVGEVLNWRLQRFRIIDSTFRR